MPSATLARTSTKLSRSFSSPSTWICHSCYERSHHVVSSDRHWKRWATTRAKPGAALRGLEDFHNDRGPTIVSKAHTIRASITPKAASEPNSQQNARTSPVSSSIAASKASKTTSAEIRAMQRLDVLLEDSQAILQKDVVPTEAQILEALKICRGLTDYFRAIKDKPALSTIKPGNEAGNLLFLNAKEIGEETHSELTPTALGHMAFSVADEAMDRICESVNRVAEDENVYMTPKVLEQIVTILSDLERPESLARIFLLYACKPIPDPDSKPIKYNPAKPDKISSAVPLHIAKKALDASIIAQNLPLCLDITEHTVSTRAFKKAKVTQKAVLPLAAAGLTPFASYALASQLAEMQSAMSTSLMTIVGTLGIMTYLGATGTIGFVALTTANDQMRRVTWASGTDLSQRWLREDERAFMDEIACAWGFKDPYRRGEEEGQDWEALKELCGIRGMVLDRVELMEGMQ